ncbi:hypothetical protein [Rothia nasimurium]|nr:hypothetical protein [Rothia nasimurium]
MNTPLGEFIFILQKDVKYILLVFIRGGEVGGKSGVGKRLKGGG